jgi:hypothetical protein
MESDEDGKVVLPFFPFLFPASGTGGDAAGEASQWKDAGA